MNYSKVTLNQDNSLTFTETDNILNNKYGVELGPDDVNIKDFSDAQ